MQEKLQKVKEILKRNNQEEILEGTNKITEKLLDEILEVNFEQLNSLYEKAIKGEKVENKQITSIDYTDKEKISEEEKEKLEKIGEEVIKKGQYAVITMAGGQRNKTRTQWTKRNL